MQCFSLWKAPRRIFYIAESNAREKVKQKIKKSEFI